MCNEERVVTKSAKTYVHDIVNPGGTGNPQDDRDHHSSKTPAYVDQEPPWIGHMEHS